MPIHVPTTAPTRDPVPTRGQTTVEGGAVDGGAVGGGAVGGEAVGGGAANESVHSCTCKVELHNYELLTQITIH